MIVLRIALNNVKRTFGNIALIPILIIMPVIQMVIVNSILSGTTPASTGVPVSDPYIETVILDKAPGLPFIQLFAAGTLVQYLLIGGMIAAIMIIAQRENKTLMRVLSCPVSRVKILCGNLLGLSMVVLVISAIFILVTSAALGVDWGGSWLNVMIVTAFVIYAAASMGFFSSAIFKNTKAAGAVISFLLMSMTFLSDSISFSGKFAATAVFTLNKWGYEAYSKLMEGRSIDAALTNLFVLGAAGTVFLISAVLLYRREGAYE